MTNKSKDAQLDQLTDSALKIIMEASPVGIIVFGGDARILYANLLASKIFAKQPTEISGLRCGDFVDCANRHKDFQGCGFSDSCDNCPLFQAIYSSVSGGSKEVLKEGEAFLERDAGLSDIWVKYKVKGIEMDGRKILIMAVDDITDRKQAEKQLDWQFRLQRLLMEISSTFINIPIEKMEPTINASLGEMAEFVGADRSYIFHYDFDQEICTNLHEWCREGIDSQINALNSVPLSIMPTLVNRHREGEPMYIQDATSIKKDGFREHLESQKIKSLLTVPMMLNNECIGFAGFDWVRHHHVYSETERHLLMVFAQMLVNIHLRKQSEKKLRESEEKYRRITENISDVVWITDLNLNSIYFSPSTDRVFGEPVSSYMHKTLEERFPPESLKKILSILSEELEKENDPQCNKKRTRIIEVEHYRVDGSQFWVSTNVSFVRDGNGKPVGIQGVTRDITDLKKSEEALRQSEAFIKSIMDNLPIGVAVNSVYPSPKFEYINDNFVKFYRTTKEALSEPGAFWDVVYEDPIFRKKIKNRVLEDCASGDPERMCWEDIPIIRKDEETFFISSKNIPISDKNLMISTVWDVTQRKQAEEALKSNYKLLRIAEKTAKFGGWSVDINKKRVLWSDEVANIHEMPRGYSPSVNEAILFYAPEFRDEMTKVFKDCADKGIPYDKEMEIITAKGKHVWVRTTGEAVRDDNGKIIKVQGSFQDINEHKVLERQLIQAQKMESVGRLAGGVAHDINNKMLVILGYAELIQETLGDSDPIYKFVEEIIAAGQKSTNIVGQLLAFARKQTISPKVCDLNEIVESMLKMIRRLIGEDIELVWMPGVNKWPVKIDPAQIDQILVNLCVNARDAVTKMGKITIETESVTIDEKYCSKNSGFLPGEYVMLAVSDNGEGMNKETLDNIFEPFFTTKPVGIGTGLGLATVYGIVKQNNGFINVYSETGEGTTFRIYLPRHSVEGREKQTENAVEITKGHGKTILLVEDEKPIMKVSKLMLEKLGYKVLSAGTPSEAIRLAKQHSGDIDLLITDVIMPEMNGRDLADQLPKFFPNIKTLFMSGYPANVIVHHGVLDKEVHFIQKPFSKRDISIKVRNALEKT